MQNKTEARRFGRRAPKHLTNGARMTAGSAALFNDTTPEQFHSTELPCHRCGVIARHLIQPGKGPHGNRLTCQSCGNFIKWLPSRSPEERAVLSERYHREAMAAKPPTSMQIAFLQKLQHTGPQPSNRLEAHNLIDGLLKQREEVR